MDPAGAPGRAPFGERLESSSVGRALISVAVVAVVLGALASAIPQPGVRQRVFPTAQAFLYSTGLDQSWAVFAPEPRGDALELYARVTFDDGSRAIWHLPSADRVVGAYRIYRWRKWVEYARADDRSHLFEPTARWAARIAARSGRRPVRVVLVRRFYDLPPPGGARPPWNEFEYYSLDLREER